MNRKINKLLIIGVLLFAGWQIVTLPATVAADAAADAACYKTYNGHGSGQGTDNKLTEKLLADYTKSSCDTSKKGNCNRDDSGSSNSSTIKCTKPKDNSSSSSSSSSNSSSGSADCTNGGKIKDLHFNDSTGTCTIAAGSGDPALKGCTKASDTGADGNCDIINKYINPLIQLLSAIVGIAVAMAIVYGGILYTTSSGEQGKVTKAKSLIRNAILSLVAYVFLYSFLQFIVPGGVFNK